MADPAYKRILFKLSGEALVSPGGVGLEGPALTQVADEIAQATKIGVQMGIVIGGGNLFRGASLNLPGVDRVRADYMGMISTIINGLALNAALRQRGVPSRLLSAMEVLGIVELFTIDKALLALDANEVVIFTAGTGNPFFTTDTAAALRGIQISAQALLKATKVDGVYDRDPAKEDGATRFPILSFSEALQLNLKFMDAAAISMCRDNELPIIVFNFFASGSLQRVLMGEDVGTIVKG